MEKLKTNKLKIALLITAFLLLFSLQGFAEVKVVDSVNNVQIITEEGKKKVIFTTDSAGACVIIPYAPDLIRVRWHWDFSDSSGWKTPDIGIDKKIYEWPNFRVDFRDAGNNYYITTDQLQVEVVKTPNLKVNFKHPQGNYYYLSGSIHLEYDQDYNVFNEENATFRGMKKSDMIPRWYKVRAVRKMPPNEVYFGLGEVPYALKKGPGTHVQYWNADTFMWGEFKNPMYMSLPFMYGVRPGNSEHPTFAYGIFFNNPARPVFMFGKEREYPGQNRFELAKREGQYSFEAGDGQIDYFFFGGGDKHTMKEVLRDYSELTGMPAFLPKWAYGHHMSRWSYNQNEIQRLIKEHRDRGIPLDAVYLDIDYFDQTPESRNYHQNDLHQLKFNKDWNPASMFNIANNQNVKLIPLIEAWLTNTDPMYNHARSNGYFVKDEYGNSKLTNLYFGTAAWIDFTNWGARAWWKNKLINFLNNYPFAGIWNDLNEPADESDNNNDPLKLASRYTMDGYDFEWNDSRGWHHNIKNTYCMYETWLTYEALQEKYPNKRPFVLSRSAWPGIQRYALNWSGDNKATWEHLRINIKLGLNAMISGQVNFGHDVGGFVDVEGFAGNAESELMTRWTQFASLTPFFRNHSILDDYNNREKGCREVYRYSQPYQDIMINSLKFRYQLMPYLYSLAYSSTQTGMPMNAPKFFIFTDDTDTYNKDHDYDIMVGDYLLAAPVYEEHKRERWVYLPKKAVWYDWYTDQKYNGGWTKVDAPLEKLPLFARAGAIIPMGSIMNHVNEFKPGYLDIHLWPAEYSEFVLFEDDGESWDYKNGDCAKTKFVFRKTNTTMEFTINAREGRYDTGRQVYILILHDTDPPGGLKINNAPLTAYPSPGDLHNSEQGYYYDSPKRITTVKVADTRDKVVILAKKGEPALKWIEKTGHYPPGSHLKDTDSIWINTETFEQGSASEVNVVYTVNGTEQKVQMNYNGVNEKNDAWHFNLGDFSSGSKVYYYTEAKGINGEYIKSDQITFSIDEYPPLIIKKVYHWPPDGQINKEDAFRVNAETYQIGEADEAKVWYFVESGDSPSTIVGRERERFKFDIYGDWSLNFGDNNQDGLADQDGEDISLTEEIGEYTITFNDNTKEYSMINNTPRFGFFKTIWRKLFKTEASPTEAEDAVGGNVNPTEEAPSYKHNFNQVYFRGTSNAWETTAMELIADYTWKITQTFGAGTEEQFKPISMEKAGQKADNDWWHKNLGQFAPNSTIKYKIEALKANGQSVFDDNNGQFYEARINKGPKVKWIGNTHHWPVDGEINPEDDVWINTESWPQGLAAGAIAELDLNADGVYDKSLNMEYAGLKGNNDWWHLNLGKFQLGQRVIYRITIQDLQDTLEFSVNKVLWIGNTHHWPVDGQIDPEDDVWINTESRPQGLAAGAIAELDSDADGVYDKSLNMDYAGLKGDNDWWHLNLGKFQLGQRVKYRVTIQDLQDAGEFMVNGSSWILESNIYQIFVKAFHDSDGNGTGDLRGVQQKLTYIDELGIDTIWLMPVFEADSYHGYNTNNYYQVRSDYSATGNPNQELADLVAAAHALDIHVILDLVINHTGSNCVWFKDHGKSDWYCWQDSSLNYQNSTIFKDIDEWNCAWGKPGQVAYQDTHHARGKFYAVFSGSMPDLNFRNPAVVAEIKNIMRYWITTVDIDGYRCDAARYIIEDGKDKQAERDGTYNMWTELRNDLDAFDTTAILLAETALNENQYKEHRKYFGDQYTNRFHTSVHFSEYQKKIVFTAQNGRRDINLISHLFEIQGQIPPGTVDTLFLSNHDSFAGSRPATVYSQDEAKEKMAASLYIFFSGIPCIYYGEEVGMDGDAKNGDQDLRRNMEWTDTSQHYCVENHKNRNYSLLKHYQGILGIRNHYKALKSGIMYYIPTSNNGFDWDNEYSTNATLAVLREWWGEKILVVHNFNDNNEIIHVNLAGRGVPSGTETYTLMSNRDYGIVTNSSDFNLGVIPARASAVIFLGDIDNFVHVINGIPQSPVNYLKEGKVVKYEGRTCGGWSKLYLRGTFNGWGTKLLTRSGDIWSTGATFDTAPDQRFKFDCTTNWNITYGEDNGDGIADLGGEDIPVTGGRAYIINLNEKTLEYTITESN